MKVVKRGCPDFHFQPNAASISFEINALLTNFRSGECSLVKEKVAIIAPSSILTGKECNYTKNVCVLK